MGLNIILASCPWGLVTANGVDLLTEIYVTMPIGQSAAAGEVETYGRKARKYIMISQGVNFTKM